MISEVDLSAPEFPEVYAPATECLSAVREARSPYLEDARRDLGIVGEHPEFEKAMRTGALVAQHHTPVLIQGETGTGKELAARLIHRLSGRDEDRFVPVNCGALPKHLVESLLFGHVKGAFTGASGDQAGKFVQADGGTLFLDEIGELPLDLQPRLLRVLEDGMVEPVGARKARKVDVRVIAATHRDLPQAVDDGSFREDLYYRLSFAVIRLPALRERRSDIPLLALDILDRINRSLQHPCRLSPSALRRLQEQHWRGNVRDLENVLGRSVMLASRRVLMPEDLLIDPPRRRKDPLAALPEPHEGFELEQYLSSARRQLILRALDISRGNQSGAARLLGISPQAVHKFIRTAPR